MKTVFLFIFLLSLLSINAQNITGAAGKYGNFIYAGREIPKGTNKKTLLRNNEVIAELSYPNSEEEFLSKVHQFYNQNPYYPHTSDSLLINYWQWSTAYYFIDSLALGSKQIDALVGFGVMYFDVLNDENKGTSQYTVEKNNSVKESVRISQPAQSLNYKINYFKHEINPNFISTEWMIKGDFNLLKVEAYKQHFGQDELNKSALMVFLFRTRDSILIRVIDTNVVKGLTYKYWIKTTDPMGLENLKADTVKIINIPANSLPILLRAKTISEDQLKAITLKWKIQNQYAVQTIDIYKSLYYDSAYSYLSTVQANDTVFTDYEIKPVTAYWYKIVINGVFERNLNTVKITGILKKGAEIIPVNQIQALTTEQGVQINWVKNTNETRGFYVYRAKGYQGVFEQISPLILSQKEIDIYRFIDSSAVIFNGMPYTYVVKTESDGYVLSENSDTVSAKISKKSDMPFISQISAQVEGQSILIVWQSLIDVYPQLAGYNIYKQINNQWVLLENLNFKNNQYLDTNVQIGKEYFYKINPINTNGIEGLDANISSKIEIPTLFAPEITALNQKDNIVLISLESSLQEGVKEIYIYRQIEGEASIKIGTLKPNETEFTDKSIQKGKTYFYFTSLMAYDTESNPSTPNQIEIK